MAKKCNHYSPISISGFSCKSNEERRNTWAPREESLLEEETSANCLEFWNRTRKKKQLVEVIVHKFYKRGPLKTSVNLEDKCEGEGSKNSFKKYFETLHAESNASVEDLVGDLRLVLRENLFKILQTLKQT